MNRTGWIIVLVVGALLACGCLVAFTLLGGLAYFGIRQAPTVLAQMTLMPQGTVEFHFPGETPQPSSGPVAFPTPRANTGADTAALDTLQTLENSQVPVNDLRKLAEELKGVKNIPETVPAPTTPFKVGDTQKFWLLDTETNTNSQIETVMENETPHSYIWVEKGVKYNASDLKKLGDTFENHIYPTDRKFFGSEWTPGVDNDPHIYIIYAHSLGGQVAGYFSSVDEINPLAYKYSNTHEAFFLSAQYLSLGQDAYSTLAHEFQHMIHWYRDRNETSWMNEGFSVLAEMLNGYDAGGFDSLYVSQPDQSLNDWPNDPNGTTPYYGSSFLFLAYYLDRFGDQATQALVADQNNGLDSVDDVLKQLKITDPVSGKQIQADDVFGDWVVTNYLHNSKVGDGRYTYHNYPGAPSTSDTEEISSCPIDWQNRTVHQYGVDYIKLACQGKVTLNFEGATEVGVLPANAHSGRYSFWSNKGDESDMTLTHEFDFTNQTGPIQMDYWTWYDLEKDYDYLYLEASQDGQSWDIITTPGCTTENKSGNSYGCGYNGVTGQWIEQNVDLSKYAGKKIQLRFEYITDAATNGEGLLVDDISIPAVGYKTDFETDSGGWDAAGFVRIENRLPQTYRLSLIRNGKTTTVETLTLDANQKLSIPLDFGSDMQDAVLVVSGTTRFTRQEAIYRFELQP